jgi:acyl-CoA synthetase (AMP-forming)/AMP-acid ligase II
MSGARTAMEDVVTGPERRAEYERRRLWDDRTLAGRVAEHARAQPAAVAVVDDEGRRRRTYRELADDAAAMAALVRADGVGAGDVVSVQLPNWYETVVVAVAVQAVGAVINPLLPNYRRRELAHVFTTARPRVIFTPAEYRNYDHRVLVADVIAETGVTPRSVVVGPGAASLDELLAPHRDGEAPELTVETPATSVSELIFTSGTEATPKAIMHTEQTTNFSVRVARRDLGVGASDVVWMPSPVGHSTGFNYGLRFALYHGLPLVLQDRWDPAVAVDLVAAERASYTLAATTFLQDLVEETTRRGARLESLRCFGCGGAPVPPALVAAADAQGIRVLRLYGSTEVLVATWNRPDAPLDERMDTDGTPTSDVDVEIRDDDGKPCGPGETGEIFVRGPNTCVGFFADPERTAATFDPEGWVRTGDLAVAGEHDTLTVAGRKKEIIIRGGINIAPREIEELILAWPEIERVAVVGVPDERLGERSCACVVLRRGATLTFEQMVDRLRATGLATYKLPEELQVVDALPTTASGKVQKFEIVRAILAGREER